MCWGIDRREAVRTGHRLWANEHLPGELAQILPTPRRFERASELVTAEREGGVLLRRTKVLPLLRG